MINRPKPRGFLAAEPHAWTPGTGMAVFLEMRLGAVTSMATFSPEYLSWTTCSGDFVHLVNPELVLCFVDEIN